LSWSKKEGKRWKEIENKDCGKNDDTIGPSTSIKAKH
jgi:hypothetical protein